MECPICFEQYNDASIRYECETCQTSICLQCLASLKKEECAFCRTSFPTSSSETERNDGVTNHDFSSSSFTNESSLFSQTYPPSTAMASSSLPIYTSMWSHGEMLDDDGQWRRSRILTRQLRRERKRMDHELQQIRNAELSRLHNRQQQQPPKKSKRGKNQTQMIFDMEMDASI